MCDLLFTCKIFIERPVIINFDIRNIMEHNPSWPKVLNQLYSILINGGLGSEKTNIEHNLIKNQLDIYKIFSFAKDPYETKLEEAGKNRFEDLKHSIEY